jgi:hypothetical protein
MNEQALGPLEGPLQRAKLHIRGGKRRLRQGKISAGIATLYDALSAAMHWYIAMPERRHALAIRNGDVLADDPLGRSPGPFRRSDRHFDFDAFDLPVGTRPAEEVTGDDHRELLAGVDSVLAQLGSYP